MATYSGDDKRLQFLFQNGGGGGVDKVGDLSSLTTTAKTNAVAAINEIDADVAALSTAVGNANSVLEQLLTTGV